MLWFAAVAAMFAGTLAIVSGWDIRQEVVEARAASVADAARVDGTYVWAVAIPDDQVNPDRPDTWRNVVREAAPGRLEIPREVWDRADVVRGNFVPEWAVLRGLQTDARMAWSQAWDASDADGDGESDWVDLPHAVRPLNDGTPGSVLPLRPGYEDEAVLVDEFRLHGIREGDPYEGSVVFCGRLRGRTGDSSHALLSGNTAVWPGQWESWMQSVCQRTGVP